MRNYEREFWICTRICYRSFPMQIDTRLFSLQRYVRLYNVYVITRTQITDIFVIKHDSNIYCVSL